MLPGSYVRSLSGHDAGKVYILVKEEGDMLFLSDGRLRPLNKLKKKKRKHVQPINSISHNKDIIERLSRDEDFEIKISSINNEEIKRAIKLYLSQDKD
ncbi:MAG: hypothetical protein K5931_05305 [Lachnospiraceae bacterium]|nr:hypothetical protein [Lachnospiraceae bacterium]